MDMPAEVKELLDQLDMRVVNIFVAALAVRGPMPLLLSPGRSIDLIHVCRYEPVEITETRVEFQTITGKTAADVDKILNKAQLNETCETEIVSPLRFISAEKGGQYVLQIRKTWENGTGEFEPAVFMADGETVILTPEENEIFRSNWMAGAIIANEYLQAILTMFPPPAAETAEDDADVIVGEIETGSDDVA